MASGGGFEFEVLDLGHVAYQPCADIQLRILNEVVAGTRPSTLIFVEHDPVLTLGANFHPENLLLKPEEYEANGIQVVRTDRGGDVTYHGPGQLVIYPIFNVALLGKDLHKWLRDLEETMLSTLDSFGLQGQRFPPHTGAWVGDNKIAAIGIKVRQWVSMHGIALNCNNDLAPFETIVPCGIASHGVTSLTNELGRTISIQEPKEPVLRAFKDQFTNQK
jgi:lipoyl(octanoyl) transferase